MAGISFESTLHPESSLIYVARVLKNRKAFCRYMRTKEIEGRRCSGRGAQAKCINYPVVGGKPECGDLVMSEIVLYEPDVTIDNVAHEITHVVARWFDVLDLKSPITDDNANETMASLIGAHTQRVWNWYDAKRESKPSHWAWNGHAVFNLPDYRLLIPAENEAHELPA